MLNFIRFSLSLLAMHLRSHDYVSATDDLQQEDGVQAAVPLAPQLPIKFPKSGII